MARIAGVDLNKNKRIDVALTKIYGIGDTSAAKILSVAGVNPSIKTAGPDRGAGRFGSERRSTPSSRSRGSQERSIHAHKDAYGYRLLQGAPSQEEPSGRGQRTHTNARTRKGPRKGVVSVRKSE